MLKKLLHMWEAIKARLVGRRIVAAVNQQCWETVRSRAAILSPKEAADYIRTAAAQCAHRKVDELVRSGRVSTSVANKSIIRATDVLSKRLCLRLERSQQRRAA